VCYTNETERQFELRRPRARLHLWPEQDGSVAVAGDGNGDFMARLPQSVTLS
jgi:hypothetical protein